MALEVKHAGDFLSSVFRCEHKVTSAQAGLMIGVVQNMLAKSKDADRKALKLAAAMSMFDPTMDDAGVGLGLWELVPNDVHTLALAI